MKKISKLFCGFLTLVIGVTSVIAYDCKYSDLGLTVLYDDDGNPSVSQLEYDEYHTPIVLSWYINKNYGNVKTTNKLTKLEPELIGMCPDKIYACTYEYTAWFPQHAIWVDLYENTANWYYNEKSIHLFYSENEMKKDSELGNLPNGEKVVGNEFWDDVKMGYLWATSGEENFWTGLGGVFASVGTTVYGLVKPAFTSSDVKYEKYKKCEIVEKTGGGLSFNLACPNLNVYLSRFNKSLTNYENCVNDKNKSMCKSQEITNMKEQEEQIKNYCNNILQNYDYDGGTEQDCLDSCLDISKQLVAAKKSVGLLSDESGECGFSARLLVWASNILRWIKYILPVAVIIFGILDFIKAIGADKDDEMKKAQKRFIIRLIAAALVFIIPLILEFVLDKMGFGYNDCGLF